jgi:organic hydroperoxide reductase OsmC/OhrA
MSDLPMLYHSSYRWLHPQAQGVSRIGEAAPALTVGTPHDEALYSPEHLFVMAAEICLANYVVLIARRSKLELLSYESNAAGELEQDAGGYRFKCITICPQLQVRRGQEQQAERIVNKAHKLCLIARSMQCPVDVTPHIVVVD